MSDEEPISIKKVEIEGKKYLLDKRTTIVYDRETQEPIGVLKDGKVELYDDDEEEEEELKVEFKLTLGDFPDWKKLGFTKLPEKYWDIDTWDNQADLLDYEDKKRFIFVSKPLNRDKEDDDIQYQLLVKKDGKKIDPVGVVVIDKSDDEILLFLPNEEFYMFLQYFGRGDIVDNLLATGFIADDDEEEEQEEEEEVDVNLEKRKEMEDVLRQLGELYTRLKQEYQDDKTPVRLKEAQKAKKILQKKKEEYIDFVNSLDNKKGTGKVVALGVPKVRQNLTLQAEKIPKQDDIWKWSNPDKVAEMAKKYLGDMAVVFRSTKPKKKYMIFDPDNKKWVFFGEMNFEDFTKHKDPKRRENYLTRTAGIKGNWKNNRYSANNLSREILW